MRRVIHGRARRLGSDINADYIITSARKRETLDEAELKRFLLETVDPGFAASVQPGDLIVADRNFGCGSAMEVAVTVIQAAGIPAVLAQSFARSFYRNAVNNGLIPIEFDTTRIAEGDRLSIDLSAGAIAVLNQTTGATARGTTLPAVMLAILDAGGLVPYLREHRRFSPLTVREMP